MDILIIVLGIIIILLIYYIYTIFNAVPSVASNIDLTKPPPEIKSSSINEPYSQQYTIGVWVYIFNFSSNNQIGRFVMFGDSTNSGKFSYWSLRMDPASPKLYCDILVNKSTAGNNLYETQTVQITDNFPIQKWVYVVTSVSAGFIECYLNGAFVLAETLKNPIYSPSKLPDPTASATFKFGGQGTIDDDNKNREKGSPMVLNMVSRWAYPLSAGDIYNNYNKGNGEKTNIWGPSYSMNINLVQGTNNYVLPIF